MASNSPSRGSTGEEMEGVDRFLRTPGNPHPNRGVLLPVFGYPCQAYHKLRQRDVLFMCYYDIY